MLIKVLLFCLLVYQIPVNQHWLMLQKIIYTNRGCTYVLDGDNARQGLCGDLGFTDLDRTGNIRRVGELVKLMTDACIITLTAFISPLISGREIARKQVTQGNFQKYIDYVQLKFVRSGI